MIGRARSIYFVATGAIGGLLGFVLMEGYASEWLAGAGASTRIAQMAVYFGGFGLAVGACLGMTEGLVRRHPRKLVYGLLVGLVLGGIGGAAGGAAGQALFGLLPIRYTSGSAADLAIVLDSSGSMRQWLFWGNDPRGKRKRAAKELIDRLSAADRVAVIDFDHAATTRLPLTAMDSDQARRAAHSAVDGIDDDGGTDLTAGLGQAVAELSPFEPQGRSRFIIFLTDGVGHFDPAAVAAARDAAITVYTIGLGSGVDSALLEQGIAGPTGGAYYPIADANELTTVFQRIFTEKIAMASQPMESPTKDGEILTGSGVVLGFRIASWALMGLVIGLGQGVRENTREDLWACGIGGCLGGLLAGGLFEPASSLTGLSGGVASRFLADIVVGACIGGSMRFAQERFVDALPRTTRLSRVLPEKERVRARRAAP